MHRRIWVGPSLAVVCWLALGSTAAAQTINVTIRGVISDQSGASLPGVTVTATNTGTGLQRSAVSDTAGRYTIMSVPAGPYDVQAELSGFATQLRRGQVLNVGTTVTIDFGMSLAGVQEKVEVTADAPILEATKNTLARVVQKEELDALPVINRNFGDLAALSPGVTRTVTGSVEVGGSRDFQNSFQVDGASSERALSGGQRIQYAQDWIQEFQVMTHQYNAEFGNASGGVINAITRSGANTFTGRGYGFFRSDKWDARPALSARKTPLDEKRLGAIAGGPLRRDQVFYFAGYEWFRNESSGIVNTAFPQFNGTVPTSNDIKLVIGKVDYQLGPSHMVRLRYNRQDQAQRNNNVQGISTQEHGQSIDSTANDAVGMWTWTVAPNALNEFRFAYADLNSTTGCNYAQDHPQGPWYERKYPGAQFGCAPFFGNLGENQYQFFDNLSITSGAHQIKFGFQAVRATNTSTIRNNTDGNFTFDRDILFDINNPASYPSLYFAIEGGVEWGLSSWAGGLFAQDSWSVNKDLTLNLGVRYDLDNSYNSLNPLIPSGFHQINTDKNNVSPRVGFAWSPRGTEHNTLVRGGAGIYFDQSHTNLVGAIMTNTVLAVRQANFNANSPLLNPFWPDINRAKLFLAQALAANRVPDTRSLGATVATASDIDPNMQTPATAQVTGGFAQGFAHNLDLSVDVVYTRGIDQLVLKDINLDPSTYRRLNPAFSNINAYSNGAYFQNRSLFAQLNYRPRRGQSLRLAYTLASTKSNTSSNLGSRGNTATNPFNLDEDLGPTDNDVRHSLNVNGSTTLPFGFQFAGMFSYYSPKPFSVTTPLQLDSDPFPDRPEPRNSRRADSVKSLDVRLSREFRLQGRRAATLFVEGFNLTNTINYTQTSYVGIITSALFGRPTAAGPMRRMQLGFRVDF